MVQEALWECTIDAIINTSFEVYTIVAPLPHVMNSICRTVFDPIPNSKEEINISLLILNIGLFLRTTYDTIIF